MRFVQLDQAAKSIQPAEPSDPLRMYVFMYMYVCHLISTPTNAHTFFFTLKHLKSLQQMF